MENVFTLKKEDYKRDVNVLKHYIEDSALFLSKMRGVPVDKATEIIKGWLRKGGKHEFHDPRVQYLERNEHGDRELKTMGLNSYINMALKNDRLIAANLTTYLPAKEKQSILSLNIEHNVAVRKKAKNEMFEAERNGDMVLYARKKDEQNNKKISNNSNSGAHCTPSTPLYNPTAHSTLTSTCRSTSGFGNANNEKLFCGNRHYWSPNIVTYNIISIVNRTDLNLVQQAMDTYNLYYPSVDDLMDCIRRSANQYWRAEKKMQFIQSIVETLSPLERAAYLYVGDFYHVRKFNPQIARSFIDHIATVAEHPHPDPVKVFKEEPECNRFLAVQICEGFARGHKIDYRAGTFDEQPGTREIGILASTCLNIRKVTESYALFIKAFWVTDNVPASLAYFPDSIRHAALTSDTDSTIFTVQDWVMWFNEGRLGFDEKSQAVAATMIWLSEQTITHILAKMSANFGIEEKYLNKIAMKNEYKFDIFVPTQVAKHYYAMIGCQEGILKKTREMEIKGVHLKSSNAPRFVIEEADKMMSCIMDTVIAGEKISMLKMLKWVGDTERQLFDSMRKGDSNYFRRGQIKPAQSYTKGPTESNYMQYILWRDVFGPKYGADFEPPYSAIKVSAELTKAQDVLDWFDLIIQKMGDTDIVERIKAWMVKYGKKRFTTFYVPEQIVQSVGIPEELLMVAGVRNMVADSCKSQYLIMESLGFYSTTKKNIKLISDLY